MAATLEDNKIVGVSEEVCSASKALLTTMLIVVNNFWPGQRRDLKSPCFV